MTLLDDFRRVTKDQPCPVCQRPDWCLVKRGDPPRSAICSRIESSTRWADAGWFHPLVRETPFAPRRPRVRRILLGDRRDDRMETLARAYREAAHPEPLARLADSLGVTVESLRRLQIGWTGRNWSFPMVGRDGGVCGIRLRSPSGKKFSERGGHEGLFVPTDLAGAELLVICEGPTDSAAVLDWGCDAVGRPSCTGGTRLLVEFVRRGPWKRHVIFADAGKPGTDGALALARVLAPASRDLRVIVPPAKDARAWKNAGASRENVLMLLDAAPPIRISVRRAAR